MAQTDVLVIIGYLYSFFNREIDKQMLESIDWTKLKKIYIQDQKEIIPNIITRLKSYINIPDSVNIVPWDELEAFCIPYEC